MTEYSVGFLHNDRKVVLIEKNRPEWQKGHLNGVGGHVEPGEHPHDTMVREFEEETGVKIPNWDHFLTLRGPNATVFCYATNDNGDWIEKVKTETDEEVRVVPLHSLGDGYYRTVPNLKWIIPLMLQRENYNTVLVNFHGES